MAIRKRDPGFTSRPLPPFPADKPFPPDKPGQSFAVNAAKERASTTPAQRRAFEAGKGQRKVARLKADAARKATRLKKDAARRAERAKKDAAELAFAGPLTDGGWVGGLNDIIGTCMATAVANSLLAATGIRAGDEDVLDLHLLAGGHGGGAAPDDVLHELCSAGIAGIRPALIREAAPGTGDVCAAGPHAMTVTVAGLVSWGGVILPPAGWVPERAWEIRW